jgi:hypothetical protein
LLVEAVLSLAEERVTLDGMRIASPQEQSWISEKMEQLGYDVKGF